MFEIAKRNVAVVRLRDCVEIRPVDFGKGAREFGIGLAVRLWRRIGEVGVEEVHPKEERSVFGKAGEPEDRIANGLLAEVLLLLRIGRVSEGFEALRGARVLTEQRHGYEGGGGITTRLQNLR